MTLSQVLNYLVSGGAVVLGAALVSWLAENVPAFQAQTAGVKQATMVVACLILALGAWAVQTYVPGEVLEQLAAPFGVAALTVAALLGNQAWHSLVNHSGVTLEVHSHTDLPADPQPAPVDLERLARLAATEKMAG